MSDSAGTQVWSYGDLLASCFKAGRQQEQAGRLRRQRFHTPEGSSHMQAFTTQIAELIESHRRLITSTSTFAHSQRLPEESRQRLLREVEAGERTLAEIERLCEGEGADTPTLLTWMDSVYELASASLDAVSALTDRRS
jgi:hypothetical protein